jgi:L-serine dehydratase
MYNSGRELLENAKALGSKLSVVVIKAESEASGKSEEELMEDMREILHVMMESTEKGMREELRTMGGLIGGDAKKVKAYSGSKTLCGTIINRAMARALSASEVNASMGRIVAAPTAGSCGILPASIITTAEVLNVGEDEMILSLFTAAGIGQIIAKRATLSGAEGGCQAECGSAAAMAAAAVVEMAGGDPQASLDGATIAIKNVLGLVCDPVAGLVECPCAKRNASGVVNAMLSADLALAGVKSIISFDEVIGAMSRVGSAMDIELKETALGGLAATPTGIDLRRHLFPEWDV